MSGALPLCGAENWRHTCHELGGHHGRHACWGGCDFTWDNHSQAHACTSIVVAVLGSIDGPVRLRCGLLAGHPGDHTFAIGWNDENIGEVSNHG